MPALVRAYGGSEEKSGNSGQGIEPPLSHAHYSKSDRLLMPGKRCRLRWPHPCDSSLGWGLSLIRRAPGRGGPTRVMVALLNVCHVAGGRAFSVDPTSPAPRAPL